MKLQKSPSINYEYFVKTDTSAYQGEWVAISGRKIISHGKDAGKVYNQAKRKYPKKEISLAKIPEEQTLILKVTT